MIQLASSLYTSFYVKPDIKLLVIGPPQSGKTTIVEKVKYHLTGSCMQTIQPTIGLNMSRFVANSSNLTVWDLGGSMRTLWANYYAECDGLVYVLRNDQETELLLDELHKNPHLGGKPVLVIVNVCQQIPCDFSHLFSSIENRSIKVSHVDDMADASGLVKLFTWLVCECRARQG